MEMLMMNVMIPLRNNNVMVVDLGFTTYILALELVDFSKFPLDGDFIPSYFGNALIPLPK